MTSIQRYLQLQYEPDEKQTLILPQAALFYQLY